VIDVSRIPPELKALDRWVVQRGKKPFIPGTHTLASPTDPATWRTFDEAYAAYRRGGWDGLWLAMSADDDLVGIDLDHCIADGVVDPWAQVYVRLLDSYTEISPSGTGLRIFLRGRLPGPGRKKGPVEVYDRDRFLSVTGNRLGGAR
jgi:putative DNA primase/helicase